LNAKPRPVVGNGRGSAWNPGTKLMPEPPNLDKPEPKIRKKVISDRIYRIDRIV
jgi:hypothetical protein